MNRVPLLLLLPLLCGCGAPGTGVPSSEESATPSSSSAPKEYQFAMEGEAFIMYWSDTNFAKRTLRYEITVDDKVSRCEVDITSLHGYKETDFSSMLPGDRFSSTFEADSNILRVALIDPPLFIRPEGFHVLSESTAPGRVVEVPVNEGALSPVPGLDFSELPFDGALGKDMHTVPLEGLEKVYATVSAREEGKVRAIYAYNPR